MHDHWFICSLWGVRFLETCISISYGVLGVDSFWDWRLLMIMGLCAESLLCFTMDHWQVSFAWYGSINFKVYILCIIEAGRCLWLHKPIIANPCILSYSLSSKGQYPIFANEPFMLSSSRQNYLFLEFYLVKFYADFKWLSDFAVFICWKLFVDYLDHSNLVMSKVLHYVGVPWVEDRCRQIMELIEYHVQCLIILLTVGLVFK